jgi:IclR family pca regulon transcriptional regulator
MKGPQVEERDQVKSLIRGLDVIRAFTAEKPAMTLSEVAERTDMNRAAARRFLLTLVAAGYAHTEGRLFWLQPKVLELGYSVLPSMTLATIAQPILDDLARQLGETCFVAVLDDQQVVYVVRAATPRLVSIDLGVGDRMPAYAMSTGRVLVGNLPPKERTAWLDACRPDKLTQHTKSKAALKKEVESAARNEWCLVDEEFEIGMRSLSVPLRDPAGNVLAALNVSCPTTRVTLDDMHGPMLEALQVASARITAALPPDGRLLDPGIGGRLHG